MRSQHFASNLAPGRTRNFCLYVGVLQPSPSMGGCMSTQILMGREITYMDRKPRTNWGTRELHQFLPRTVLL